MTLSRWLEQVNSGFAQALAAALLTGLFVFFVWREGSVASGGDETLGRQLAAVAAAASVDGLIDQDYIELGVIANRLAAVDGVAGVAIYRLDDKLLALGGEIGRGVPFTEEIVFDGQLVGLARISLDSRAGIVDWGRVLWSAAGVVGLPALVVWMGRIRGIRRRRRALAARVDAHYLLAASLRSGHAPDSDEQRRALNRGLRLASMVGALYRAECRLLAGEGILMAFKPGVGGRDEDRDRAFQALCAAFLLAEGLIRLPQPSDWRVGMQATAVEEADGAKPVPAVDARVLAALAEPGTVAVSDAFLAGVRDRGRIRAEPLAHPILRKLVAEDKQCHVVTGLAPAVKVLIDHQVERLVGTVAGTA